MGIMRFIDNCMYGFEVKSDAEEILLRMRARANNFGKVRVIDLKEFVGIPAGCYDTDNYYWLYNDLSKAKIFECNNDEYALDLSECIQHRLERKHYDRYDSDTDVDSKDDTRYISITINSEKLANLSNILNDAFRQVDDIFNRDINIIVT